MSGGGKSILILGGGIIGLCTAYYASLRGHRVTVIDRGSAEGDRCSVGNAGMVVPSHFVPLAAPGMVRTGLSMMRDPRSPFYIRPRLSWELMTWGWRFCRAANAGHVARSGPVLRDLHLASLALYEELAAACGNAFGLTHNGLLMLCKTQHTLDEEAAVASRARALGIPAEVLDRGRTAAKEPGVAMAVAGAVYFPKDCHLTPGRVMEFLRAELGHAGVGFAWETEFLAWKTSGRRVTGIETSRGEFDADEFVLCAGSWSSQIGKGLGVRLPMQAGKGYSLTLSRPRKLPKACAILTEARVAVTPMGEALRFGGTMEIAGMDERINMERVKGIVRSVPRYYPEFTEGDFEGVEPWRGLRPCSPDGLPYLGRTRVVENLTVATGHGMMGVSLGPVTGRIVAEIISGEEPGVGVGILNPDRFA